MRSIIGAATLGLFMVVCGIGENDGEDGNETEETEPTPPPPPQQNVVTVVANSNPPGATVTGGGRELGVTPLETQVPVPPPQPGQVQTFAFTFQLAGYQPATINAAPVNNMITITAALAPQIVAQPVDPPGTEEGEALAANEIRVVGRGGGPIFDNHTTTGTANVEQACMIDTLTVRLNGRHAYYGDLHITLRGPDGRAYSLKNGGASNPFRSHRVRQASGHQAQGEWRVSIADQLAQDSGNFSGWSMTMTCTP